nr:MAG TPA: hypothetical protein [Caudoviricetes sp.]
MVAATSRTSATASPPPTPPTAKPRNADGTRRSCTATKSFPTRTRSPKP